MNCFETGTIGPCMSSVGYKEKNFTMKIKSGIYATDKGEVLVVFGGGIILSGAACDECKMLAMHEDGKEHVIGEDLGMESLEEFNKFKPIRLLFYDKSSIDVLINELQQIRDFDCES